MASKVADPYRWLEDDNSPETAAWVEAQNKVTFPYLERIPYRAAAPGSRRASSTTTRSTRRRRARARTFFFSKNDGLQNQSVLYIQKGFDGTPEVLIDPNAWSADGTVRLSAFAPSKDAKYAVYGDVAKRLRLAGIHVMELATKKTLDDKIEWVKVSGVAWQGDGFFYSRYPAPPEGQEKASINENHRSTSTSSARRSPQDALVYEDPAQSAALPHRRDDRRRAVRDPVDFGARQGQGRERAVRARSVESDERDVHAARSRRSATTASTSSTTSATSCSSQRTTARRTGGSS